MKHYIVQEMVYYVYMSRKGKKMELTNIEVETLGLDRILEAEVVDATHLAPRMIRLHQTHRTQKNIVQLWLHQSPEASPVKELVKCMRI